VPGRRTTRRRPLAVMALILIVLLALAVGGILAARRPGAMNPTEFVDKVGQHWRVEVAAVPARAPVGSVIEVTLSITNTTQNPQAISFSTNRQIDLVARNDAGKVVWRSPEPSVKVDLSRSVGDQPTRYTRTWTTAGLAPGRYTIEGAILAKELAGEGRVKTSVALR
jgi:hypothetical protein